MLTIKQLQTFFWVARLGTVSKAAERLHVTQSAATKRLQELEAVAAVPLFEPGGTKGRLSLKGKEMLADCERLLNLVDQLERIKKSSEAPAPTLRIGLGELTALTWFPAFLRRMRAVHPTVTVQPEIDMSTILRGKVAENRLDFAIIPDPAPSDDLTRVFLGHAQFGWFAAPGTFRKGVVHPLHELAARPVIEQSENSIITTLCARLWEGAGVNPERIYGGNNVVALAGLISADVGVSCLPTALFEGEVAQGRLQLVETSPPAPEVGYYCCFLKSNSALGYSVANIARQCCTFERASGLGTGRTGSVRT
jgi:DNA-binding transcriptional LysR family regulator